MTKREVYNKKIWIGCDVNKRHRILDYLYSLGLDISNGLQYTQYILIDSKAVVSGGNGYICFLMSGNTTTEQISEEELVYVTLTDILSSKPNCWKSGDILICKSNFHIYTKEQSAILSIDNEGNYSLDNIPLKYKDTEIWKSFKFYRRPVTGMPFRYTDILGNVSTIPAYIDRSQGIIGLHPKITARLSQIREYIQNFPNINNDGTYDKKQIYEIQRPNIKIGSVPTVAGTGLACRRGKIRFTCCDS